MKNKNLIIAEHIAFLMSKNDVSQNAVILNPGDLNKFTYTEIERALTTLSKNSKSLLDFSRLDPWNTSSKYHGQFKVEPKKKDLERYKKIASNEQLFLKTMCSSNASDVLKTLESIKKEIGKNKNSLSRKIEIEKFFNIPKVIKILYKISIYSDSIDVTKGVNVGFTNFSINGFKQEHTPTHNPDYIKITNIKKFNEFSDSAERFIKSKNEKMILAMLKKHGSVVWRCKNKGHFIDELKNTEIIEKLLNDFALGKYKSCEKCREKNYFNINNKGDITFLRHPAVDKV